MLTQKTFYFVGLFFTVIFLTGCQPKVSLMPAPVRINPEGVLFDLSKDNEDENYRQDNNKKSLKSKRFGAF